MDINFLYETLQKLEQTFPENRLKVVHNNESVTVTDDINGCYDFTPDKQNDRITWLKIADGEIVSRFETKDRDAFLAAVNALYFEDFGDLD